MTKNCLGCVHNLCFFPSSHLSFVPLAGTWSWFSQQLFCQPWFFLEPIFPPWEDLMTLGAQPSGYIIPMSIFFNAFCSASHRAGPGILMHMNYAFLWGLFLFSMEQRVKLASVLFIFWLFLYYNICLFKKHTNTKIDMFGYCTVCVPFPIPFPWFGLLVTIPSLP